MKLREYREKLENRKLTKKEQEIVQLNYENSLFNYYEYLAICIYKELIHESESKLYFKRD